MCQLRNDIHAQMLQHSRKYACNLQTCDAAINVMKRRLAVVANFAVNCKTVPSQVLELIFSLRYASHRNTWGSKQQCYSVLNVY